MRENNAKLENSLGAVRRRAQTVATNTALLWGVVTLAAVLLAAVWLDVLLELPGMLRVVACGVAAVGGAAALAGVVTRWRGTWQRRGLAERLDAAAEAKGQVVAGADLAEQENSETLTAGLAALAVRRAGELAEAVPARAAIPARPMRAPALVVGGLALVVLALAALAPDLLTTQWQRFADPFGDHPPYSRTRFKVDPGEATVVYGQSLNITASAVGAPVDRMEVVWMAQVGEGKNGGEGGEVLPMFEEGPGQWRTTVASVTTPGQYVVRSAEARTKRFTVSLITVPRIEQVTVRIEPPAYTHEGAYEGPIPEGGIAGLPGAKVQIKARSNRALSRGIMELTSAAGGSAPATGPGTRPGAGGGGTGEGAGGKEGGGIAMKPEKAGASEVSGAFVIERSGTLTLRVVDEAGQASTDAARCAVSLLQDGRPFVRIAEPAATSFATPEALLPVVLHPEDDYGISSLELYRGLNNSRATPMKVDVPPRGQQARLTLPLAGLGLQPGDVITLYARAEDNDPAGAKGSESTPVKVQIISQEEFEQMMVARAGLEMLESKYAQAQRRLEAAAEAVRKMLEEFKKDPAEQDLTEEHRAKLGKLAENLQKSSDAVREAAGVKLPFDLDKAMQAELGKVEKQLSAAGTQLKGESEKAGETIGGAAGKLEHVLAGLAGQKKELAENATEPLEHLSAIFPLIEDEARFTQLYERQRDLAERMDSLKGKEGQDDPKAKARMRDMEAEQKGLHQELERLLDDIAAHTARLPDKPELGKLKATAEKFEKAVRGSKASELMGGTEMALADFAGSKAADGGVKTAEELAKFISMCQGEMGEEASQCLAFQPKLAKGMGNTVAQLLAAAGLMPGMGGRDGSGGYGMASHTLQNVGLYGRMPLPLSGRKEGGAGPLGSRVDKDGQLTASAEPGRGDIRPRSGGESGNLVPAKYRKRVGQYFQRVADELEQNP